MKKTRGPGLRILWIPVLFPGMVDRARDWVIAGDTVTLSLISTNGFQSGLIAMDRAQISVVSSSCRFRKEGSALSER